MQAVVHHLNTLYSPLADPEVRRYAEQQLDAFQCSFEAWNVARSILVDKATGADCKLFAAQTLRRKIVADWTQLDATATDELTHFLLTYVCEASECGAPNALLRQTSLAFIYVCVQREQQSSPNAADPLAQIFSLFETQRLSLAGTLQLLALLPEECRRFATHSHEENDDESAAAPIDDRVIPLLTRHLQRVVRFLFGVGEASSWSASLLECLFAWVRCGIRSHVECLQLIKAFPIVELAFSGITAKDAEVAAGCCAIVAEIIFQTAAACTESDFEVQRFIVAKVHNVLPAPFVAAQAAGDEELCEALIDVFAECLFSYDEFLMSDEAAAYAMLCCVLLWQPTSCDMLYAVEKGVSLWENCLFLLRKGNGRLLRSSSIGPLIAQFVDALMRCFAVCEAAIVDEEPVESHDALENNDVRAVRRAVRALFVMWAEALGFVPTMQRLVAAMSANLQATTPPPQAAALRTLGKLVAAIGAIADPTDSVVVPPLLQLLRDASMKNYSSQNDDDGDEIKIVLKRVHLAVLRAYAPWFGKHAAALLSAELPFVLAAVRHPTLFVRSVQTFAALFDCCSAHINSDAAVEFVMGAMGRISCVATHAQLDVYEAVARLLAAIQTPAAHSTFMQLLCATMTLQEGAATPETFQCIDRLEVLATFVKQAGAVFGGDICHAIAKHMHFFRAIDARHGAAANVMESVGRVLRYAVEFCGTVPPETQLLLLQEATAFCMASFARFSLSWPVYVLRCFVRVLGAASVCDDTHAAAFGVVHRAIVEMCAFVDGLLTAAEIVNSDVVYDFFRLQTTFLATPFADADAAASESACVLAMRLAIACLRYECSDVTRAAVDFLCAAAAKPASFAKRLFTRIDAAAMLAVCVTGVVHRFAPSLTGDVALVLRCLCLQTMPETHSQSLLLALFREDDGFGDKRSIEFKNHLPAACFSPDERVAFVQKFGRLAKGDAGRFADFLHSFACTCQRRLVAAAHRER